MSFDTAPPTGTHATSVSSFSATFSAAAVVCSAMSLATSAAVSPTPAFFVPPSMALMLAVVEGGESVSFRRDGRSGEKVVRGEMTSVTPEVIVSGKGTTAVGLQTNEVVEGGGGMDPVGKGELHASPFFFSSSPTSCFAEVEKGSAGPSPSPPSHGRGDPLSFPSSSPVASPSSGRVVRQKEDAMEVLAVAVAVVVVVVVVVINSDALSEVSASRSGKAVNARVGLVLLSSLLFSLEGVSTSGDAVGDDAAEAGQELPIGSGSGGEDGEHNDEHGRGDEDEWVVVRCRKRGANPLGTVELPPPRGLLLVVLGRFPPLAPPPCCIPS